MRISNKILSLGAAAAIVIGLWARFYQLGVPAKQIFDEVYFPVFANDYLTRVNVFDVHPPFGKFLIAIGIAVFGNTSFGWRIVPALFGAAFIPLAGFVWWRYSRDWAATVFFVMCVALEPMLIVYSRTGLLDGMQLFFILACFGAAVTVKRPRQAIGLAVLLGLAASIKWVALGVLIPVAYIMWRKKMFKSFLASLPLAALVYFVVVLIGQILNGTPDPANGVLVWHYQAFEYHLRLTATHPWSSQWYTWPFMLRPVLFLYDTDPDGKIRLMTAMGNPVLWWASTAAVVASLAELISLAALRQKIADHPLVPLLLGYGACLLPWIPIHRVVFLYHYLPCYLFATMMVMYWFARVYKKFPAVALLFAVMVFASAIYFLPFAMGTPLTQAAVNQRIWVNSWLYGPPF